MNAERIPWATESMGDSLAPRRGRARSRSYSRRVRVTLYAVLAVLRPFVVAGLSALALLGLALSLFYTLLVPGSHFPTALVLVMSVASAVLIVVFYALMELLLPE